MENIEKLNGLGIKKGDIVLIHSSISRISRAICPSNPRNFCDVFYTYLLKKVGSEGTLVFPTFFFGFCSGNAFSVKETKSEMGVLTNYALSKPEAIRTNHPIYSFAVIGKYAEKFSKIDNVDAFSQDSVFGELKRLNGKIMIIDLPYNKCMTFFHHVEEIQRVDYRFHKEFKGLYTDRDGNTSEKTYSMYVRDLGRGIITSVEPMGQLFEQNGSVKKISFENGSFAKIMDAAKLFNFTIENMSKNPRLLYEIDKVIVDNERK